MTLFDNRLLGEEEINGRKAWVIDSMPHANNPLASGHEQEVLSFRKKFWIDEAENVLLRQVFTVVADRTFAKPGSTVTFEFERVDQDTWQANLIILDIYKDFGKVLKPSGRTEYHMSGFQKFDVQSTITADVPK